MFQPPNVAVTRLYIKYVKKAILITVICNLKTHTLQDTVLVNFLPPPQCHHMSLMDFVVSPMAEPEIEPGTS
jgi:hypothetical protein